VLPLQGAEAWGLHLRAVSDARDPRSARVTLQQRGGVVSIEVVSLQSHALSNRGVH
jgi:hypothetical protein